MVVDIFKSNITVNFYGWRLSIDPIEQIDSLTSHHTFVVQR
ncbi:MAG: hypothetical protein BAJALOKI3v1_230051 [Promethearchaeota archaeon]|nr:MAG: hypothetical protein BAJALOKI3v1_230051 [Candidatus Lokiarchaeota archaeon]